MKQYFYISLLLCTAININFVLTVSETYVNNGLSNQTQTQASKSNSTVNTTTVIFTDGGKVDLTPNIPHQGREHVISTSTTVSTTIERTSNATSANSSTISKSDSTISTSSPKIQLSVDTKPVTDVDYTGDSRVKPRKGVSLNDSIAEEIKSTNPININATTKINIPVSSTVATNLSTQKSTTTTTTTTTTTVSTTTFIPKKPTVTYGSDEEDPPPRVSNSRLFIGGKQVTPKNSSSSSSSLPPAHTEEEQVIVGNRHYAKGSPYVLPIVLTILAVPLLAIILTVVYKRGAEWWNHRHYRRMDFLIDGMYNN